MPINKPRTEKRREIVKREVIKKQKHTAIFEVVETFEELGRRMRELLLTSPKGTRIYLRVRDRRTLN